MPNVKATEMPLKGKVKRLLQSSRVSSFLSIGFSFHDPKYQAWDGRSLQISFYSMDVFSRCFLEHRSTSDE